jgi:hypothetical protein
LKDLVPTQNVIAYTGADWKEICDLSFAAGDLTGCEVTMTISLESNGTVAERVVDVAVTNLDAGAAQMVIAAADLENVEPLSYQYAVRVEMPSGERTVALKGIFKLMPAPGPH